MSIRPGCGVATSISLDEDDLPALDLLPLEAHQHLAVWTIDRKFPSDDKLNVARVATRPRLLKGNKTTTRRAGAPDRQIPLGCGREV